MRGEQADGAYATAPAADGRYQLEASPSVDAEATTLRPHPTTQRAQEGDALPAMASEYGERVDLMLAEAMCGSCGYVGCEARELAPGEIISGKYRVEGFLGRGGMGTVVAARHLLTGKRVALKWMRGRTSGHSTDTARLIREASAVGRLDHPNVVAVYDAGMDDGHLYIAMELLQGESLDRRLARGRIPVCEAVPMLLDVLGGVAAAHAAGIIHRDLKPANIFLCIVNESTSAKVLDFGVSLLDSDQSNGPRVGDLTGRVGTPQFMAPEQVRGEQVDARADLYSLCVTLYRMLTGHYPHEARAREQLFVDILTTTPKPAHDYDADIPRRLSAVLARGLERNREQRYQDAQSLIDALAPWTKQPGSFRIAVRQWLLGLATASAAVVSLAAGTHRPVDAPGVPLRPSFGSVQAACESEPVEPQPGTRFDHPASGGSQVTAPRKAQTIISAEGEAPIARTRRGATKRPYAPHPAPPGRSTPSTEVQPDKFMRW